MALLDLIAQGGRGNSSPITKFVQGQQIKSQRELAALQKTGAQQDIKLNRLKQQEAEMGIIAPLISQIGKIEDPTEQQAAYERGLQFVSSKGIDVSQTPQSYSELKSSGIADAILSIGGIEEKETFEPLFDADGKVTAQRNVVTNKVIADPRAPTKQETGTPGSFNSLTNSDRSKTLKAFTDKKIQARKFVKLSDSVIESVNKNATQLGVVGAIARIGDEIRSVAKNVNSEFGIDLGNTSNNVDDYEFGSLSSQSAEFKTNALSLALIFASASGLGEGRALTNKDVQRSLNAIGASTNSPTQLSARMKAIQNNLNDSLKIEADERGFDFNGIPELNTSTNDNPSQVRELFRSGEITREEAKKRLKAIKGGSDG